MIPQTRRVAYAVITFENLARLLKGSRMVLQGGELTDLPEDIAVFGVRACLEDAVVHRLCKVYLASESFEVVSDRCLMPSIGEIVPFYVHVDSVRSPARGERTTWRADPVGEILTSR